MSRNDVTCFCTISNSILWGSLRFNISTKKKKRIGDHIIIPLIPCHFRYPFRIQNERELAFPQHFHMASPLHYQLPPSHASSTASTRHRKSSTDKLGLVERNSSTNSLHRSISSKSNSSTGLAPKGVKHHHLHVAHTGASKHHRTSSFGHRVPSYGKGLNKLTSLSAVNSDDAPKEHLSIHSIVARAGGTSMQRSHSEGSGMFPLNNFRNRRN